MTYIITLEKLEELNACKEGVEYFKSSRHQELKALCYDLVEDNHATWANWLLTRLMTKKQRAQYAVFAAQQVLHIFEEKYPDDKRPRKAIEAAINYINNPASYASASAASAAYAAAASDASAAASDASASAASAAAAAAAAARKLMQVKIIDYGCESLTEGVCKS